MSPRCRAAKSDDVLRLLSTLLAGGVNGMNIASASALINEEEL